MKVSEMENYLQCGDVIIHRIDTNIFTGKPMKKVVLKEMLVTWVRNPDQDGPNEGDDYDVQLMDDNGETSIVQNISSLDDLEYSHNAFKFGAKEEK